MITHHSLRPFHQSRGSIIITKIVVVVVVSIKNHALSVCFLNGSFGLEFGAVAQFCNLRLECLRRTIELV